MKKILTSIAVICAIPPCFGQLSFNGVRHEVISIVPEASTGLSDVYVLFSTEGVSVSYSSANSDARPEWSRFSNLGGGFSEPLDGIIYNGTISTLPTVDGDMGYIIRDGSKTICFWVVDYSKHTFTINGISVSPESDCTTVALSCDGKGDAIRYYTINGQGKELERDIKLKYSSLEFNADTDTYSPKEITENYSHLNAVIFANTPLCDTDFTISGDRFLRHWGMEEESSTSTYQAIGVEASTSASQDKPEIDNEQSSDTNGALGGSAPSDITFSAVVSDAVVFTEWQMSKDPDFGIIDYRESNTEFSYTFQEAGTTYVRFMASNAPGTCDYYSPTYEVSIGESDLKCPNAFSPGSSEGINDEWKVSYKSIISFECHIFNRWGVKVATLKNPAEGWNGKYNGKFVPAGVYYYVINAKGADGKTYKLKGDINIINFKKNNTGNSPSN